MVLSNPQRHYNYVWNGHAAASEIVNVSAKQTESNL